MDKEATKVIKEQRKKERKETKKRHATNSHSVIDIVAQRLIEKLYRIDFNQTWSTLIVREVSDRFD